MVIVDTTVWIEYLRGSHSAHAAWLNLEVDRQRLGLLDVILSEVLQGIPDDQTFSRVRDELLEFEVFATGGAHLAIAAAQHFRFLRRKGHTVRKTIDCWIATFCILEGHSLLHHDRDFDPFEQFLGLSVLHP